MCAKEFRGAGVSPAVFLNVYHEIKPAGKMPTPENANAHTLVLRNSRNCEE
jgi:hypothetical protein